MTNFADKTIWTGDNLDILRGLNSASVDLIYLDPPFNSNRNYAAPVGSAATWRLTTLFRSPAAAPTISRTCSCCAPTATQVKGDRPQEYLVARLREMGMAA